MEWSLLSMESAGNLNENREQNSFKSLCIQFSARAVLCVIIYIVYLYSL